jgi:hypothetical protein
MRCDRLLMWIDHIASPAPSLARSQAPAQARFSAAQTPRSALQAGGPRLGLGQRPLNLRAGPVAQ